MTAPALLSPLTLNQVNILHARLRAAHETISELLYGSDENCIDDEGLRSSLRDVQGDISDLSGDACDEMGPAHEREIGAERVRAAEHRNHLARIAEAEQLLAAERQAGVA